MVDLTTTEESPRESLEARIQLLEDREAIRDLIRRYGLLCDQRRWDDLLELYDDDIERQLAGTLDESVRGKEVLRALLEAPALPRKDPSAPEAPPIDAILELDLKHMLSTELIRISDDGAKASAHVYYTMVVSRGDAADFERGVHDGHYEFTFKKHGDIWRFSRQVVTSNNATNPLFQMKEPEEAG